MYYLPKRKIYKVLRSIFRRVVVPILTAILVVLILYCCYLTLTNHQLGNPLRSFQSLHSVLGEDGFYLHDRRDFMTRYRLDSVANGSTVFREILLYGGINNMEDFPELSDILSLFSTGIPGSYRHRATVFCPNQQTVVGLTVSTEIEEFRTKDAVVFGMMPKMLAGNLGILVNLDAPMGQTWVYFSTESPFRALRWVKDLRFSQLRYHKLMTYNSNSDIPCPFGYTITNKTSGAKRKFLAKRNFAKGKSKLIAWMASNCEEIFWPRNEFVERVRELVRVDTYGRCGAKDCLPRGSEQCKQLLGEYKFYLTLANTECRDYITEKFWDTSLKYGIVPVVGGAPRQDFERVAPPHSFIHIADFQSIKELVDFLLLLDTNDAMYNKYFEWKQTTGVQTQFPPKPELFCEILPHLNDGFNKVVRPLRVLGDSTWFKSCRNKVNISSAVRVRARVIDNNFDKWTPWRL
ncbi:alpha-(1,3)-fucosyltransferase 4-like [Patiria miniata]|uniref:Fucosyltransferase n=1 Tax=Patiria miniata TaxID=46514 RepID=A0A914A725_PATMI|nr:alpha-(1,3)-fucosyltransferase 4-like [Patiria miniata]